MGAGLDLWDTRPATPLLIAIGPSELAPLFNPVVEPPTGVDGAVTVGFGPVDAAPAA